MHRTQDGELYLRNIIFGVSDSLVSTVGLLAGIDVSGTPIKTIVLTGVIYAFVEAFSMAVGSFLSEESAEEYEHDGRGGVLRPFWGSVIMFLAFVLASFIPIAPYLFFSASAALTWSIANSIAALAAVGIVSARIVHVDPRRQAIKTAVLGGAAILLGVVVGKIVK